MAERAAEEDDGTSPPSHSTQEIEDLLTDYVSRVSTGATPWESDPKDVVVYTGLAQLLLGLGLKQESVDLTHTILRNMELVEVDEIVYSDAELWNHLGALLAEQGDLVRAKATLVCALNRSHRDQAPEKPAILANLSETCLQMGDPQTAAVWAAKTLDALKHAWGDGLDARLTADRVRLTIARSRHDATALRDAVGRFAESVRLFAEREGAQDPRALDAQVALAAAQHEADPGGRALSELEYLHVAAQVTLGPERRETITAQATLAAAEFEAAGGWDRVNDARTQAAVNTLKAARDNAMASPDLGQEHPQTNVLQDTLADMRAAITPDGSAPYHIERVYLPQENRERNKAKKKALRDEPGIVRLIAHAGASYFLRDTGVFYRTVSEALKRKVRFAVIISSPWSTLAAFLPSDVGAEPGNYGNIEELVKNSDYYKKAFLKVTDSYQRLKKRFPEGIELRITPMDIAGSTLLTTDVGFYEPYISSNPNGRTLRGMSAFEVKFRKDSQYYPDSRNEFTTQWELSSTWDEFRKAEGRHIETLQAEMQAHGYVRVREKVRRGEVPRP